MESDEGTSTYSSSLLANTSGAAGDEDDLARHVWYVCGCKFGATGEQIFVEDGPQNSHVGYDEAKWSSRGGCREFIQERPNIYPSLRDCSARSVPKNCTRHGLAIIISTQG